MSLQLGLNNNMSQYSGYVHGLLNARVLAASDTNDSKTLNVPGSQEDKLMKKLGVIECTTCKNRKYVDDSDDPDVSFKTPTHLSLESSGAAVMSHEHEHVSRENSKARAEGRRIVFQSVRIYTAVCPECGRVYTSGGKTTTATKADNTDYFRDKMRKFFEKHYGKNIDVRV